MDHFPSTSWGKPRQDNFDPHATFPIHQGRNKGGKTAFDQGVQRTQQPIVTGTSVLGLKFNGGVLLAADNLASYGSLARFKDIKRLHAVGTHTVLGASGDMADFQQVQRMLEDIMISEAIQEDGHTLSSSQIYEYLSNVMYAKRSKFDPYWNSFLVAGVEKGQPCVPLSTHPSSTLTNPTPLATPPIRTRAHRFLSYVDLLGTTYSAPSLATGFGMHLAQPLLRRALEKAGGDGPDAHLQLDEKAAREVLENAMKVLFYRDARSLNKYQIATVTEKGVTISEPISAPTEWAFAEGLRGYGNSDETY